MNIENYIIKNIELYLESDYEFWDLFFEPVNILDTDIITRYGSDIGILRQLRFRHKSWEFNINNILPFVTYWVDSFTYSPFTCNNKFELTFRIAIKNSMVELDAPHRKILNESDWIDLLITKIYKMFYVDNIFCLNKCKDYETVDCDNNIIIEKFKYNIDAKPYNPIQFQHIPINRNNEWHEYQITVPLKTTSISYGNECC